MKKKINVLLSAAVVSVLFSSNVIAADQGGGDITFKGEIIDAPCSIESSDTNQLIDMGSISNVAVRDDTATKRYFKIHLINCDLSKYDTKGKPVTDGSKWKTVNVTFMGDTINTGKLLRISDNVGIELTNGGKVLEFGKPSDKMELTSNQQMEFYAQVRPIEKGKTVELGQFNKTARFQLAYQ
ncbi:TPA: fimbrial protein [Escherichia coli]